MLDQFQNQIAKAGINPNHRLLLAVSGGVDSMVLWSLIQKGKNPYAVAQMNFSLRGKESLADQEMVQKQAEKLGVAYHQKVVDTKNYAEKNKLSIQMAARELRYNWFDQLLEQNQYDFLLTAHHLDDAAETFLIHLDRGTGLSGLLGIPSEGKLIRPMLNFSKAEILTYAQKNKISYREDQSNASTKYLRNWFRHEIILRWKKRNPEFLKAMKYTMANLEEAHEFMQFQIEKESNQFKEQLKKGYLNRLQLLELSHPKLILRHLLLPFGFSETTVEQLLSAILKSQSGRKFFGKHAHLILDREKIFLQNTPKDNRSIEVKIEAGETETLSPLKLSIKTMPVAELSFDASKYTEVFDREALKFPLLLRKWKAGDRMNPLGMKGEKKLSDLLIDKKIPLHKKGEIYVIESEGKIVWVLGIQIDERFKVKKTSRKILQIQWEKSD